MTLDITEGKAVEYGIGGHSKELAMSSVKDVVPDDSVDRNSGGDNLKPGSW